MLLTRREWYLAGLSGALLALALPPLPTGPLAWVALVPFLMAIEGASPGRAARIGFALGLVYHVGALYWIAFHVEIPWPLSILSWLLASVILALYTMVAAFGVRVAARWTGRAWAWTLPPIWVATEYARYTTEFAFPWSTIGHTQAGLLGLIQQADIWGVLGVSFWLCVLNVVAYRAVAAALAAERRRPWQYAGAFVLIVLATATYGRFRLNELPAQPATTRIALVQPNVDMETKWASGTGLDRTVDILRSQTLQIEPKSVDLVIWPETAIPDYVVYGLPSAYNIPGRVVNPRYRAMLGEILGHTGVPLVTGTPAYDYEREEPFNSAAVIMPESLTVQTYDKRFLVPFGERVPYSRFLGFLDRLDLGIAHWTPGRSANLLRTPAGSFGVAICFESVFPGIMRQFVREGADFLVVVTNDAWFGRTSLIYQHAEFAAFRAIESRVWIARAANTGISAFFDPWGRMVEKTPVFRQRTLTGTIGRREGTTLYLRWGDWIARLSAAFAVVAVVGGWWVGWRPRKRRR